jgi:hypothetical protein
VPCEFQTICLEVVFVFVGNDTLAGFLCMRYNSFLYFTFVLAIAITIAILVGIALTLAPPKGFKFRRFFSRIGPNATNNSQVPPINIVVPTLVGSVQPTNPIGESSDKKKSYENNCQLQFFKLPLFLWVEPIFKEEATKVICKVCSKIYGKSIILVAKNDNM